MDPDGTLKILVVDDTIVYRKIVSEVLKELPKVNIVGTANNGKTAVSRISTLQPDLITLDVDMPGMNGLEVLAEINHLGLEVGVIMLSSLTHEGGEATIKALELGAFDFIPKPELDSISANKNFIKEHLAPMLRSFASRREIKQILAGQTSFVRDDQRARPRLDKRHLTVPPPVDIVKSQIEAASDGESGRKSQRSAASRVAAIGISTGGPKALVKLLPQLPDDINIPILVVQHMPALFTKSLAQSLDAKSSLTVKEAEDGEVLAPNTVFIAPGGQQMKISAGSGHNQKIIRITDDPPENSCKPSVDYLFRSVAKHFGSRATGVIMTGMGADGNLGFTAMREKDAFLIAQDQASCTVFGMPRGPIESNIVDVVASLDNIATEITASTKLSG